jgi:large subunit ribosomal protein L19e
MKLTTQKRLASGILKCSPKKVWLDNSSDKEIKEAITKADINTLIKKGLIAKKKLPEQSRARARTLHAQKVKGRKSGKGSKKGKPNARLSDKIKWILKIRSLRVLLKDLKDNKKISVKDYRDLYAKAKGGFFRNKRHLKLYINEHNMMIQNDKN